MTRYKPKKDSLVEFNRKYANNDEACEEYFFQIRYPDGYVCENVVVHTTRRSREEVTAIHVLPVDISSICLLVQSFRITSFLYTSCF